MNRLIIFSDLDGTLLDHHTYEYGPARPALERLRSTRTPLVLVSSKTRPEIEALRAEIGNHDPFIPENGGAIVIPRGCGLEPPDNRKNTEGDHLILLGRPASELKPLFDRLAGQFPLQALSRMAVEEITAQTGLAPDQARAAGRREYGEAFLVKSGEVDEAELEAAVRGLGLRLTKGGRFYHLLGENDKGRAVLVLTDLYRRQSPRVLTAGIGDARNDEPMLAAVDYPYLVMRPDGTHADINVPGLVRVPEPGPWGFNRAVQSLLDELSRA